MCPAKGGALCAVRNPVLRQVKSAVLAHAQHHIASPRPWKVPAPYWRVRAGTVFLVPEFLTTCCRLVAGRFPLSSSFSESGCVSSPRNSSSGVASCRQMFPCGLNWIAQKGKKGWCTKVHKNAQKRTKMHKNAQECPSTKMHVSQITGNTQKCTSLQLSASSKHPPKMRAKSNLDHLPT